MKFFVGAISIINMKNNVKPYNTMIMLIRYILITIITFISINYCKLKGSIYEIYIFVPFDRIRHGISLSCSFIQKMTSNQSKEKSFLLVSIAFSSTFSKKKHKKEQSITWKKKQTSNNRITSQTTKDRNRQPKLFFNQLHCQTCSKLMPTTLTIHKLLFLHFEINMLSK